MLRNREVNIENLALFYIEKACDVSSMSPEDFAKKFKDIFDKISDNVTNKTTQI